MEFETNEIVNVFNSYHLILEKRYDEYWKDYSYKTLEYGYKNGSVFVLTMKEKAIHPGTDGGKNAKPGKTELFTYIFNECKKII